ncbi:MAG: 2-succinyl-5-enolpyruvyl-6-hydroxy-3-cyclohexene-1-carboxylic-acid synthase, partial [Bacteroidia bacterium]
MAADTAVISPGSRNAPVIYALGKSGKTCHSIIDERSAAFVALGIAKQTRKAVILSCTSGTAALNYYPAIAEAYYARVPLIILTADRPSGKIDAWDGQAIRQNKMYSAHVRAEFQTPEDYSDVSVFREIAAEANSIVENNILGPIHINVPIREPFYNFSDEMIEEGRYVLSEPNSHKVQISSIPQLLNIDLSKKKVLIFNGMDDGENIEVESDDAAVVLSDITSRKKSNIDYWDALLFSAQCKTEGLQYLSVLKPDIVISTGTTTVSKGIKRFLQSHKPEIHVHLSKYDEVGDMFETNPKLVNPKELNKVSDASLSLHQGYVSAWQDLTKELRMNFEHLDWSLFNEFSAVNYILSKIPDGEILHLSNSMPVRYASFLLNGELSNKVYCNRGT